MERVELLKLKAEIEADLVAVNRLLERPERERKISEIVEAQRPPKNTYQLAEEIIKSFGKDFTVQDICFELVKFGKRWTPYRSPIVSQVINKLRQRNPPEIEVVESGRGSRSGVYRYKKP